MTAKQTTAEHVGNSALWPNSEVCRRPAIRPAISRCGTSAVDPELPLVLTGSGRLTAESSRPTSSTGQSRLRRGGGRRRVNTHTARTLLLIEQCFAAGDRMNDSSPVWLDTSSSQGTAWSCSALSRPGCGGCDALTDLMSSKRLSGAMRSKRARMWHRYSGGKVSSPSAFKYTATFT